MRGQFKDALAVADHKYLLGEAFLSSSRLRPNAKGTAEEVER